MNGSCLEFNNPIRDAISRIRFAPLSNNLLVSSWDSILRFYDVECSRLRLEAPSEAALLDCCFQEESVAFSAGSDGSITRYDLHSGISNRIGNHDEIATCVEYSNETRQVITAGFDKKIIAWDMCGAKPLAFFGNLGAEVESMSISGFELTVAAGSSVDIYDLRNLDKSVESNESCMGVPIRCVCSIPFPKGYAVGSVDGRVKLEISYLSSSNNMGYSFRCHPKSRDRRNHLVPVNDIAFNPLISGAFVTGDNEGYVTGWDAKSRRRLFELPRCSNSVASLTYNHEGQILAVASSYTYQEATEMSVILPFLVLLSSIFFMLKAYCHVNNLRRLHDLPQSAYRMSSLIGAKHAFVHRFQQLRSAMTEQTCLAITEMIHIYTILYVQLSSIAYSEDATQSCLLLGPQQPRVNISSSASVTRKRQKAFQNHSSLFHFHFFSSLLLLISTFPFEALILVSIFPLSPEISFSVAMSDEEHHFESKADAGASKTYPQQAGTIRKNGYIVIKGRPCKVVEVSTSKTGKHGHAKCHFVGIDIFTAKKLEDIVPSSHNCDVPHVNRTDYQLIDISEDGFVSLLTENGNTKDDLRLPTDDNLLTQIKDGFAEGKDLVVTVMSAMGEEQICALKDIGPK
ncbi:uncharacterized protein LOC111282794 [Durio zibethinus]|uniref:Uncharacterized protein LOC111282794 n=2 Tax=rosids TaxID=71275 RepID=A0A6P5XGC9_DURZI|nr:uncharacterized protein LOC111282794 [Durio zibethinus]